MDNYWIIGFSIIFMGAIMSSTTALSIELAAEIVFPVGIYMNLIQIYNIFSLIILNWNLGCVEVIYLKYAVNCSRDYY